MNMKYRLISTYRILQGMALAALIPITAHAQTAEAPRSVLPMGMSIFTFLILGVLLLFAVVYTLKYRSQFKAADSELQDISAELEQTRQRFTETKQSLEKTEQNLKHTTQRYQGILFDARIGMFQLGINGKCTYINSALQELSGLHLKKATKEGLQTAIHPDDRKRFNEAWKLFISKDQPFSLPFRFKHSDGREVHVMCLVNKVYNENKKVESFIGWVSNVTDFHEARVQEQVKTSHYSRFIEDTVEGYYQLAPETPIPLTGSADKTAAAIIESMKLVACNETFAGLYGTAPSSLIGKSINALQGGCGPFKTKDSVKKLITADFSLINAESVRQDPRGNRINLINNVIGIVEDNKLVGIWGSQRNVSQQKREKAELTSRAHFLHRILDALPADVHVKDTRCRYLYASHKLADRTGIKQEDWIGKTIFEVLPATPRDHDKSAIEVMKSGKLNRIERSYETRKKSGWMETVQIPLFSEDGLIEGVVGLSFETSERRKKEETILTQKKQLEQQLQVKTDELRKSRDEHNKAVTALKKTGQELRIRESEVENQRNEFDSQLKKRKQTEERLQKNEQTLLTRQKQLEENLSSRLAELEAETDKRKKWEELISIKENELQKLEKAADTRSKSLEKEVAQRKQTEAELKSSKAELEKFRTELESIESKHGKESTRLKEKLQRELGNEQTVRKATEQQLNKTKTALQAAQSRIQELIEQHSNELEHEVAERKTASSKLIQHAEELDELKRKFNERIEKETKGLKQELAHKQIQEKALRQQSKDLETRIKELEKSLNTKIQETNKQVQAREGAEVQRQQAEQQLEHLTSRQKQLVERETQKLNLQIAEIRLQEIKLRKEVGDLEMAKDNLAKQLQTREAELEQTAKEKEKLSDSLSGAQEKMKKLKSGQAALIAKETKALQTELKKLQQSEADLRKQEEQLKEQSGELEKTIGKLSTDLKTEVQKREAVETDLKDLQTAFDASQKNVSKLIKEQTATLEQKIEEHQKNEAALKKTETALKKEAEKLQKTIDTRTDELSAAQQARESAEKELAEVIKRSSQGAREIEAKIADIKKEHQAEIQRVKDEQKELRQKEKYYRTLIQASADAFLQIDLKDGKIQSANLASATLFGEKDAKALTGRTLDALSPKRQPDDTPSADMAKARLHTALEAGHESFEWQFLKADKETFHGLVSFSTIKIDDKQMVLAVINNISDLKQQQADLEQIVAEAHAANEMNSRIVEELTENVQATLSPVLASTESITKGENITDDQKKKVNVINLNCRTLIDKMQYRCELSRMADGTDTVESGKCDLHGLIKDLDQQFTHRAETKKLFFALSYAQYQSANNVPKFVETDEQKVRSALGILLGYALEHTEKGRLGLHAARKADNADTVSVAFELTYTGIKERDELLSQVFDPDSTGAEDLKYGLTLARRYIRQLDGDIILEYRQSDITALTINLPFRKVASEIVMPDKNSAEAEAGAA